MGPMCEREPGLYVWADADNDSATYEQGTAIFVSCNEGL
jgi:hypothetical protein